MGCSPRSGRPAQRPNLSLQYGEAQKRQNQSTEIIDMKQNRSFAVLAFFVILGVGAALAYARYRVTANLEAVGIGVGAFILALVVASAIQVADQWDRAVILRLGHFHSLRGPGLFFIIPVIDAIPYWIDTIVIVPSTAVESMQLGGLAGMTALS